MLRLTLFSLCKGEVNFVDGKVSVIVCLSLKKHVELFVCHIQNPKNLFNWMLKQDVDEMHIWASKQNL